MKLLDEREVYENGLVLAGNQQTGFRKGVEFAESKLLQLMVKFSEWLDDNMWTQYESEDKQYVNVGKWYNTTSFRAMENPQTIEQLLEQFLKTKQ